MELSQCENTVVIIKYCNTIYHGWLELANLIGFGCRRVMARYLDMWKLSSNLMFEGYSCYASLMSLMFCRTHPFWINLQFVLVVIFHHGNEVRIVSSIVASEETLSAAPALGQYHLHYISPVHAAYELARMCGFLWAGSCVWAAVVFVTLCHPPLQSALHRAASMAYLCLKQTGPPTLGELRRRRWRR